MNTSETSLPSCSFINCVEPTSSKNTTTLPLYNVNSNESLQNAEKFNKTGDMIHIGEEELRWNSLYITEDIGTENKQDHQKSTMNTSETSLPSCSFINCVEPTSSKNTTTLPLYNVNNNESLQNAEKFNETGDMIHMGEEELRWNSLYKSSKEGKDISTENKQDHQKPTMNDTINETSLPSCSFANCLEPTQSENTTTSLYNVNGNEPLQNAVEKFNETGDMIHIVKEELRWHLLYKRSKEGKEDISTDEDKRQDHQLREDEIARITRRREQNRIAAQRCRMKKKHRMKNLEQLCNLWQTLFNNYEEEISRLRLENINLKNEIQQYRLLAQNLPFSYQEPNQFVDNYICPQSTAMANYTPGFAP